MTSPRGTYGGGYYASSAFFPDTPIYDRLVAERGTPQIAPIRVPSAYEGSNLPALPALPSAGHSYTPPYGMQNGYLAAAPQPAPYQQQAAPTAYIPQQAGAPRGGYTAGAPYQAQAQGYTNGGYETGPMRPVPPRPVPPRQSPAPYSDDPYRRPYQGPGY
ncbi:DUF6643 family protein [Wenjunlia tyrosinilytica]|uniref:Uncharacterized protein n=1 Tax=Wenjunlia tyrosinilytica TaxID=1544741 RepID=A0A918E075_9ACTN|nr:DUF6643 family protein [Wenjunlia tyrosinilytica]GGO96211.1 hypothetical protein GCM10012280_55190 [Wenjunlia tyrosinilytica]